MDLLGGDGEQDLKQVLEEIKVEVKESEYIDPDAYEEEYERAVDQELEAELMGDDDDVSGDEDEKEPEGPQANLEEDKEEPADMGNYDDANGADGVYASVFNDRERAGGPPPEYTQLYNALRDGEINLDEFYRRGALLGYSLNDRFKMAVGAYYESVDARVGNVAGFSPKFTLSYVLSKIDEISNLKYRNPRGFVLGAKALIQQGGRAVISKPKLDFIYKNNVPAVAEDGVTNEDVFRYARWWSIYIATD